LASSASISLEPVASASGSATLDFPAAGGPSTRCASRSARAGLPISALKISARSSPRVPPAGTGAELPMLCVPAVPPGSAAGKLSRSTSARCSTSGRVSPVTGCAGSPSSAIKRIVPGPPLGIGPDPLIGQVERRGILVDRGLQQLADFFGLEPAVALDPKGLRIHAIAEPIEAAQHDRLSLGPQRRLARGKDRLKLALDLRKLGLGVDQDLVGRNAVADRVLGAQAVADPALGAALGEELLDLAGKIARPLGLGAELGNARVEVRGGARLGLHLEIMLEAFDLVGFRDRTRRGRCRRRRTALSSGSSIRTWSTMSSGSMRDIWRR
jgi:hypothetical protein